MSSSDRANLHVQPSHVHIYGFSPVTGYDKSFATRLHSFVLLLIQVFYAIVLKELRHKSLLLNLKSQINIIVEILGDATFTFNLILRQHTCVGSSMSFQMRTFRINFCTAFKITSVHSSFFL